MNIKQKNFVSAVVYVHDAANVIERFLETLYGVLNANFEKFEVICVDDASMDNSKSIIKKFANKSAGGMLSIVNMSYYQGVEAAMRAGIDLAIGDFVFEFDEVEIDYEADMIMQVYNRSLQGFDVVSCGKGNLHMSSNIFYSIYNRHSSTQYALKSETFRIISRRGINRVQSMSVNMPYRKAVYSNCGLKIDHINYKPTDNNAAKAQRLKNPHDTALTALILFTNVAYKISLVFTLVMMIATLISVGYAVTVYLMGNPVAGYTTTMILISGGFFAIFAVLVVIIKYLSVLLGLVFNKQRYVIEGIEKITNGSE